MPVYSFLLKVNGVDVASYGFVVSDMPDQWDAPAQTFDEVAIPGTDGNTETTLDPILAPRDFVIPGTLIAASASAFEDAMDTLKLALYGSTLTMIGGNRSTRQRTGRFASMTSSLYSLMDEAAVQLTVHCANPLAYETSNTTVSGSATTDLACALGTYKSRPVITLTTATNPVLLYKNSGGTTKGTLTITGSGTIVVDCAAQTVTIGGVRSDSALRAGDFFAFDPRDGVYGSATWPTIRTSSGSLSAVYAKAYL